jgi:hypothetical protein
VQLEAFKCALLCQSAQSEVAQRTASSQDTAG